MPVTVTVGNGGFVELRDAAAGERLVVRLLPDDRGRWTLREIWFSREGDGFSAARMRDLPLRDLEQLANDPSSWLQPQLRERANTLAPQFEDVADTISTTYGSQASETQRRSLKPPPVRKRRRHKLYAPERVDDAFLHEVAEAYRDFVARGVAPAPAIAEEAGVSARTVHAWIRKAREPNRGILPPGKRGAAG